MPFINDYFGKNKGLLIRYIIISVFSYGFVFAGLIVLIDLFTVNKTLAFVVVYGINYFLLYKVQLSYLFRTTHHNKKVIRFIVFILSFYLIANVLYNIGLWIKLHYLVATILTVVILMPFRLWVSKNVVFKD